MTRVGYVDSNDRGLVTSLRHELPLDEELSRISLRAYGGASMPPAAAIPPEAEVMDLWLSDD